MSIFAPDTKIFTLVFRTFSIASVLLLAPAALAGGKGHAAHQHGVAVVNIVGEGSTLTVQLEAPSDSIYGFEHEAKKAADIKKRDSAIEKLKTSAEKMFVLEPGLGCKMSGSDIKPFVTEAKENDKKLSKKDEHKEGTHSEVHATFKFECTKPVAGSKLEFAAKKYFKSLSTLKVQVLSGEKQDGTTIKNDKGTVNL
jgi:hypothetical protein